MRTPAPPWKDAPGCSEAGLAALAGELARALGPGARVLLEGPMGAGKTTFARALLEALGVVQPPEGSPSFAIAHEYALAGSERENGARSTGARGVVHVDLYRIKSEEEIEEAGIPAYFWDDSKIVLCEWLSMWKGFEEAVTREGENWRVVFEMETRPDLRRVQVFSRVEARP